MSSERTFEPTTAEVGLVRRFVLAEVGDAPKEALDAVAVGVSELASNAVLHAQTEFRVLVERSPDSVRVDVVDSGDGFPEPRLQPPSEALHGRGLFIIKHLAEEWGISESAGSKTVWFRISLSNLATKSRDGQ